ncbi:MAG: hypothetical protein HC902_12510, partial [Calothrix sp. SM1_5_4]|nr:hypothetical protein [Calothrix sp. SM1_5_4]
MSNLSNSNMDPFDEFEFKPLTDGLGFHKKTVSLKEGLNKSGVLEDELHAVPAVVPKALLEETLKEPAAKEAQLRGCSFGPRENPLQRSAVASTDLDFSEPLRARR